MFPNDVKGAGNLRTEKEKAEVIVEDKVWRI